MGATPSISATQKDSMNWVFKVIGANFFSGIQDDSSNYE